ncbi:MAG TPA: ATP-binding protein [Candidatus Dormibacteraeota bacterium]
MTRTVDVISWVSAGGYVLMTVLTVASWARQRTMQRALLAIAIGLLGMLSVVGRVQAVTGHRSLLLAHLTIPAFLASGYALALFRHSVMRTSRVGLAALFAALVAVSAGSVAVRLPSGLVPAPTATQWTLVWGMVLLWSGCVVEPATRFWLASAGRPTLQRARLRALSAGYGSIVVLLVAALGVGIVAGPRLALDERYQLVVSILGAATVPLLYVGFAPPRWLRRLWRDREESALRRATAELLLESDAGRLADRSLDWALRLVGADRGLILGPGRQLLAARDIDPSIAGELITLDPGRGAHLVRVGPAAGGVALVAPLPLDGEPGLIVVVPGAFTPVFGGDEVTRLGEYAVSVASALERARLVEALAAQTRRHESILSAMSDLGEGFVMTRAGRIVYANEAFCGLTGHSLDELLLLPAVTALVAPEKRATELDGQVLPDHLPTALLTRDGRRVEVEVAGRLLDTDPWEPSIAICRDITQRRRDEQELARRSRELERSNAALEEFAYIASHDLQEPLRMVASYLELLERRHGERLNDEAEEFLGFAVDGARRMQALINDLLLYSRAGGQAALVPTDCGAVVATVLATLRPSIEDAGARVVVEPLPTVEGDRTQLAQVFQNLIANAIKFRGAQPPQIVIGAERRGEEWRFSVRDNGIGIERRHAERIFMVFKRLHPQAEYPGTGIGLAICRRVVDRHGGRIWVEPAPGGGSVFRFTLPAAVATPTRTEAMLAGYPAGAEEV